MKKISTKWKITILVLVVLVIARIILPYVVLHYANKRLASMPGYYGHIEDIDIHLYRGAYTIKQIYINKLDSATSVQTRFFSSNIIDLSIEWPALFHGSVVGKLAFETPMMRFTKDKVDASKIKNDKSSFADLIKSFMPLRINRFDAENGKIEYIDQSMKPVVDVEMNKTQITATNLSNVVDSGILLPSSIAATSNVYEGKLIFNMKLNPLAKEPTFSMNVELKNTNLVKLNNFLTSYANVDVNRGTFSLYSEVAASDGHFKGYVKPIIKDLKVYGSQDENKSFMHKVWEELVGVAAFILKNHPKDQIASKVLLEGNFGTTHTDVWYAIMEVLRNAFIQALVPALDHDITINPVTGKVTAAAPPKQKTLWQKIFGGGDTKPKKK